MAVTRRQYSWDFRGSDISCSNILREGKPMTKFFKISLCICGFALLFSVCSMAQMQNGQFTGTVTDPSGAAVPSAKVTITNQATNLSVSTTTNSTGFYTAKELPVGTYKLMAEAPGFKTFTDVGVVLNAGTIAHVDARLIVGSRSEVVDVTGQEVAVQTQDTKLSTTVSSAEISNLVLNGRNVYDL